MSTVRLERAQAGPPPVVAPGRRRRVDGWVLAVVGLLLVGASWAVVLGQADSRPLGAAEVLQRAARFAADLVGAGRESPPAWATVAGWQRVGGLAVETVVMSVLAVGLAGLGALLTLASAARSLALGEGGAGPLAWALHLLARGGHTLSRAVPEVVWALLVVFVVRPGVLAGALALALHEVGVLGRLGSDVADSLDRGPLRALRAAGASRTTLLLYGVLPQVLPQLVTFLLYRWEVVLRASVVVGFLTGAGLGFALRMDLSFRRWTDVALVLLAYVLLVWAGDALSSVLRRLAR